MRFIARIGKRQRVALALPAVLMLAAIAQPVRADSGDPQSQVDDAQQSLQNAQIQAQAVDDALAQAQATLSAYAAQLDALQARIAQLDATVAADAQTLADLEARLAEDRARLSAYLRQSWEHGGSEATLAYVISATDIANAVQRKQQVDHVADAAQELVDRIHHESQEAAQTLAADRDTKAQLSAVHQQLSTQQALVAVQTEQVQAADVAAHQAVNQAQDQLMQAQQALAQAQAALAAARAAGTIFSPVPGPLFTVDTDLTQPSGEDAPTINHFLQGTAMAGLGESFMQAEQKFHISARYFVAHAILESNWGQSAIAHDKHNLFGFNANDSNPYGNASSFPSFDACIQYVAQFVATNYLAPSGRYYHGPTLRGMNVDYATDPNWAAKIARIAGTIPTPSPAPS